MAPKTHGAAFAWQGAMDDRKTIMEMGGEFLREAAVLSAVFIPLDRVMMGDTLTFGWVVSILANIRWIARYRHGCGANEEAMKGLIHELTTNQTILAMFPIVGLSIIVTIVVFYQVYKERRESQEQHPTHKNASLPPASPPATLPAPCSPDRRFPYQQCQRPFRDRLTSG